MNSSHTRAAAAVGHVGATAGRGKPGSQPRAEDDGFLVELLGVRGSTPSWGPEFAQYGGATSCIALRSAPDADPDLVLDAGTGVRDLGDLLSSPFRGTVLLTHLHWDHVHGLPFSGALLDPTAEVEIVVPHDEGVSPIDALLPGFSPPAFPVRPDELSPGWRYTSVRPEARMGDWHVRSAEVRHKGGRTVGYRVERNGHSVAYLPDHDLGEPDPEALRLVEGVDVLLHDAQYVAAEIERYRHFGHSTVERAAAFADAAGVGHLVLFHHAPDRPDDALARIAEQWPSTPGGIPVTVARQRSTLRVGESQPQRTIR